MVKVLIVEDRPEDTELMVRELRQTSLPLHWRAVASEREYRQLLDWTPDPVRDRPHSRATLHAEFRAALAEFGARVCSVRGTGESRIAAALNCIAMQV